MYRHRKALFLAGIALLLAGCQFFPESTFELAADSRLPVWVELPVGVDRKDVTVSLSYYIKDSGREAHLEVSTGRGRSVTLVGAQRGMHPIKLENPTDSTKSGTTYEVITSGGVADIVEHRNMDSRFYMVKDEAIFRALGVPANNSLQRP